MSRIHYLLKEYGNYVIEHADYADEWGENILHRYAHEGFTDHEIGGMRLNERGEPLGRDKVLCPDMPSRLRRVEQAINRLDDTQQSVLRLWYCLPPNEQGMMPMTSELADFLGMTSRQFHVERRKGVKHLEAML